MPEIQDMSEELLRTSHDQIVEEVAETARALCAAPGARYCSTIFFVVESNSEAAERSVIGFDPARFAPRGELLRIDDHLIDGDAARLQFRYLLRRQLEPFIIGVGQIRVVWGEGFEGVVILPFDPNGDFRLAGQAHDDVAPSVAWQLLG
jgi:hypothetical protein